MICNKCQKEINDNHKFCPNCGASVENQQETYSQSVYSQNMNNYSVNNQVPNYYNQPNNLNKNNNTKTAIIIIITFFAILFFIILGFFLFVSFITYYVTKDIDDGRSNINSYESNISSNYNSNYNNENDDIKDTLDSLSAWNRYSSVRNKNIPAYSKDINGNWLSLSDNDVYWVFENNTFYWYKSKSNLKDNYWYGTTKIYTGALGFRQIGLSESKMQQIILNSNGKLTANDFKTVICTPTKLIVDGKDKSKTITASSTKKIVWILVDHGTEGIEGQYLDIDTGDTAYYYKVLK